MLSPFIKLISTCTGHYFYDVGTNTIIKVTPELYQKLQIALKTNNIADDDADIICLKKMGYLSSYKPDIIRHPLYDWCDDYLKNLMYNPILQITQDCNFKCRYCTFSGDGSMDRKHSKKTMPWNIAKKALDFAISNNRYNHSFSVSFYGGEPLLEFPLIKKCVEYVNQALLGKEIRYHLTTNVSCISEEMVSFFIANNFLITLSIDGPQELHDKNRRMAATGMGTFEFIIKKLQMIHDMSEDFFRTMNINCVWDMENDIEEIIGFFNNHPLLSKLKLEISIVDSRRINTSFRMTEQNLLDSRKIELYNILNALGYINSTENKFSGKYGLEKYSSFERKLVPLPSMPSVFHHNGPCLPGYRRLFVDINGNFLPCEKVSNSSPAVVIGNVNDGINIDKVKSMLNIGKLTENECKNCWAMHFCDICLAHVDDNFCLSSEMKKRECRFVQRQALQSLKSNIIMREIGMPKGGF